MNSEELQYVSWLFDLHSLVITTVRSFIFITHLHQSVTIFKIYVFLHETLLGSTLEVQSTFLI